MSRHGRLESLFLECAALPREEREAFLDARCAGDPALKAEVLDLLGRDANPDTPSLPPFVEHPGPVLRPDAPVPLPESIGPYRILRRLGEGGFGEVFEAEQERPVRRRVALKVLKAGMDTRAVLARFDAERQALALMDHPGVARVLDAGETEAGRPFFAMELVDGEPITEWCDRKRASLATRIELVIAVCRAVEHAHQKGIIHRDLKPTNILVAEADGVPTPKVIDFGIAKATLATGEAGSFRTRPEEFLGTPEYMSPEQAVSGGIDVDTRTDVYSLGVVLYRLLTGRLPFESETLRGVGLDEVRRILRDQEPPRPSECNDTARALRGELDWIILRAMEKERTRRYASPASLAEDLGRHLREEPVLAGPPGVGYRIRKLVRRRRGAVAAAAAVLLAVTAGIAATALQAIRATRAEEEARRQAQTALAVNDFLTGMLSAGNPEANPGGHEVTVREIVDRTAASLGDSTFESPEIEAEIRHALAGTYLGLGRYLEARPHAERTLALTERIQGAAAPATIERQVQLARIQGLGGDRAGAESRLAAIAPQVPADGQDPMVRSSYLQVRGGNLASLGRIPEADSMMAEAVVLRRARFRSDEAQLSRFVSVLTDHAGVKRRLGKLDESAALSEEAIAAARRVHGGDDHHDVAMALGHLAGVRRSQGRYPSAESLYRASLAIDRRVVGARHPFVASSLSNLGLTLSEQGRFDEAERLHREALDIVRGYVRGDHESIVAATGNLAAAVQEQGRLTEALDLRLAALAMARRVHGPASEEVAIHLNNLASIYRLLKRYDAAAPLFLEADSIFVARLGPAHPPGVIARYNLGKILMDQGRGIEAEPHLREAERRAAAGFPPGHPNAAVIRGTLGLACLACGRAAEAESLLLGAHATLSAALGPKHQRTRDAAGGLADVYRTLGRPAEVRRWSAAAEAVTPAGAR